jgi:hypothetical protein
MVGHIGDQLGRRAALIYSVETVCRKTRGKSWDEPGPEDTHSAADLMETPSARIPQQEDRSPPPDCGTLRLARLG